VKPQPAFTVLLVDDEEMILKSETTSLHAEGITNVVSASDSTEVTEILEKTDVGLVVLDLMMPGLAGEELLPLIRLDHPELPVLVITGRAEISTAVECMKAGATDFLAKPVDNTRFATTVHRLIEMEELRRENIALRRSVVDRALEHPEAFSSIVTAGDSLLPVMRYVEAVAASSRAILVMGETGVGKELFASAIHTLSGRDGSLVAVNIAGLNEELLSDSLFGHRRGAFTGADSSFRGLIDQAAGGTLFLDEIGELSHGSQVKLLRLLESGEYYPLGSTLAKRSAARIVAATNADLDRSVKEGRFRSDLYYRLGTHSIRIPPLRDRPEDVPALAAHFAQQAAAELGKQAPSISGPLAAALQAFDFPGNVRQLKSMVYDAVARNGTTELAPDSFGSALAALAPQEAAEERPFAALPRLPTARQAQELLIDEALRRAGGNQTKAAKLLGLTQQAVSARLKKRGDGDSQEG
jgi:DNA-binding NtrC family response regulator